MKRVMLTVAYDGTNYHGWQIQQNGVTIEGVLNRCLSELLGEEIQVSGSSRTDSGVHAMGNLAVFDTNSPIPAEKMSYALNQRLPEDIRIQKSEEVEADFHPRFCSTRKTYEYRIYNAPFPMPTKRLYSHFTYVPLDVDRMKAAAKFMVGEHDFKSFCSAEAQVESTVRMVDSVEVMKVGSGVETGRSIGAAGNERSIVNSGMVGSGRCIGETSATGNEKGCEIVIRVSGRGFLYNMVRIMAGTLMEVGRGHIEPEDVEAILLAKDRQKAGPTAPACGLTLVGYEFL